LAAGEGEAEEDNTGERNITESKEEGFLKQEELLGRETAYV